MKKLLDRIDQFVITNTAIAPYCNLSVRRGFFFILLLFTSLYLILYSLDSSKNFLHLTSEDYDVESIMMEADHFASDLDAGVFPFPNRKGHMRTFYYVEDGASCLRVENYRQDVPLVLNQIGEPLQLGNHLNNCYYIHYNPLHSYYFGFLRYFKIIGSQEFSDFVLAIFPIHLVKIGLLYLVLVALSGSAAAAVIAVVFYLGSSSGFNFIFELYQRPFELTAFLLVCYCYFWSCKPRIFYLSLLLYSFFGVDFAIPAVMIAYFFMRRLCYDRLRSLICAFSPFLLSLIIFKVTKLLFLPSLESSIASDFFAMLKQRMVGDDSYWQLLPKALQLYYTYFEYINSSLFYAFALCLITFLVVIARRVKVSRTFFLLLVCFVVSWHFIFIFPHTMTTHAYLKYRFLNCFYLPVIAFFFAECIHAIRKWEYQLVSLFLMIYCFVKFDSTYIDNLQSYFKALWRTNQAMAIGAPKNNQIIDIVLYKEADTREDDGQRWGFTDSRKYLVNSTPPYNKNTEEEERTFYQHRWGKTYIHQKDFSFLLYLKKVHSAQEVLLISEQAGDAECSMQIIGETGLSLPRKPIRSTYHSPLNRRFYHQDQFLIDLNHSMYLFSCKVKRPFILRRVWLK